MTATAAVTYPEGWTHHYAPSKTLTVNETMRVEAGLHMIRGNSAPYFSVTATVYDRSRPGRDKFDRGGCLHDEILQHFPELAPVVALHLADLEGQPMYAEENGWYWLVGYYGDTDERYHGGNGTPAKTPDECLAIFAAHVRLPLDTARQVADGFRAAHTLAWARKELYQKWVQNQRPRWQAEASAGIALLDRLIADTPAGQGR